MEKQKRTIVALLAAAVMSLCFAITPAFAEERPIGVYLDNYPIDFGITEGQQVNALTIYDYAYVPVAKIIEVLTGSPPSWDDPTKTASFEYNGKRYQINTNLAGIYVNGIFVDSPTGTPPVIINSRTLIPLKMLTGALGFEQRYDGTTHTVWLTTPPVSTPVPTPVATPAALPTIISGTANKAAVSPGETVTITVKTNKAAIMVKIVDLNNNILAEAKSYVSEGNDNVFTLDIKPAATGQYRIYSGAAEYNTSSYMDVALTVNAATLAIDSVTPSNTRPTKGDIINITAVTTTDTVKVWLNHPNKGSFSETVSGYSDYNNRRTWTISYKVDLDNYQNIFVYAANATGNSVNKSFALDIIPSAQAIIYDAYPQPAQIETNAPSDITVITSTDISRLEFSVSGSGNMQNTSLTSYSDSGGQRFWYNRFNGSAAGISTIYITAYTVTGATANKSVTITTTASSDTFIHSVDPTYYVAAAGEQNILFTVFTGLGVNDIVSSIGGTVTFATSNGSQKSWLVYVTAPATAGDHNVTLTSYNSTGAQTDSKNITIRVN